MRIAKLLSDWMLVELEPEIRKTAAGLLMPDIYRVPVYIGKVLMAGSGRHYRDKFVPMEKDIVGQRVAFMAAASDGSRQGMSLMHYVEENQRLIRQGDVLFVVTGEGEISK